MDKINYVTINYQTPFFFIIFSKWKMFQMVQMKEENVIIYSSNSLQCGYLKYYLSTEKDFNIIQIQRVSYLGIRWNTLLPPIKHHVLKIDPTSYQTRPE